MMIGQKHSFNQRKRQGVLIGWKRIRQVLLNICAINGFPTPHAALVANLDLPSKSEECVARRDHTWLCCPDVCTLYGYIIACKEKIMQSKVVFSIFAAVRRVRKQICGAVVMERSSRQSCRIRAQVLPTRAICPHTQLQLQAFRLAALWCCVLGTLPLGKAGPVA